MVGGINQEFGIGKCKLMCIKQKNNKVLLYSTGNYIQYLVINYNGKGKNKTGESKKYICIYKYIDS